MGEMTKVAQESLSALRTVQAFNANTQEQAKFHDRIQNVLTLARKEAIASGIFFGSTGWSGNMTILGLLGYGELFVCLKRHGEGFGMSLMVLYLYYRWNACFAGGYYCWGSDELIALHGVCGKRSSDAHVRFSRFLDMPHITNME